MHTTRDRRALSAFLVLLLMACSEGPERSEKVTPIRGSDAARSQAPPPQKMAVNACALVTKAEAEAILGPLMSDPALQTGRAKSPIQRLLADTVGVVTKMHEGLDERLGAVDTGKSGWALDVLALVQPVEDGQAHEMIG